MAVRISTTRIELQTWDGVSVHDLTETLEAWIGQIGVVEGLCVLSLSDPHCALTVTDDLESTCDDIVRLGRDRLRPDASPPDGTPDGLHSFSDSGYAPVIAANTLTLPVRVSRLATGAWESVVLIEADGPARRQIDVTVVGQRL